MSDEARVWAVFRDERAALSVAERWPDAELFSSAPLEIPHGTPDKVKARLGLATIAGGTLGGLLGGLLAAATGIWMGLDVGGLPRLPAPPIGIVTFAGAALGAIGAALIVLLVRGRILSLKLEVPEPTRRQVADGAIAVMLRARPEERAALLRELATTGAEVQVVEVE